MNNIDKIIIYLLCIHVYIEPYNPGGSVVERLPGVQEFGGSVPGRVIPKILKVVLGDSLLSALP